jgi:hypothetical protein
MIEVQLSHVRIALSGIPTGTMINMYVDHRALKSDQSVVSIGGRLVPIVGWPGYLSPFTARIDDLDRALNDLEIEGHDRLFIVFDDSINIAALSNARDKTAWIQTHAV